jgi:hypothetical protein
MFNRSGNDSQNISNYIPGRIIEEDDSESDAAVEQQQQQQQQQDSNNLKPQNDEHEERTATTSQDDELFEMETTKSIVREESMEAATSGIQEILNIKKGIIKLINFL